MQYFYACIVLCLENGNLEHKQYNIVNELRSLLALITTFLETCVKSLYF